MTKEQSNKIKNMSIVCALLVVVIHCRPKFTEGTSAWWVKQMLENGITQIAVPFFFIVSGYFLARGLTKDGYKEQVCKRVRTLLVPYFFWNAFQWLVPQTLANCKKILSGESLFYHQYSLMDWGIWPFDTPGLSPLWYVRALFLLVLISPLLLRFLQTCRIWALVILFMVYGIVCPWSEIIWNKIVFDLTNCGIVPVRGIFYFALGIAINIGIVEDVKLNPWVSVAIGLVLFVLRAYLGFYYFGFFAVPFALYGMWQLIPSVELPNWLVGYSFSIYVIHKLIMWPFFIVVNPSASVLAYIVSALAVFILSLIIANLMHKFLPKFSKFVFGGR